MFSHLGCTAIVEDHPHNSFGTSSIRAASPEHQSLAVVRDVVADAGAALYAQPRIGADSAGADPRSVALQGSVWDRCCWTPHGR